MRFENFSSGYYCGSVVVDAHPGPQPVIHDAQLRELNRKMYSATSHDEAFIFNESAPVMMKLDTQHFSVFGSESVSEDTLFLPYELLEDMDVTQDSEETVFVVKPSTRPEYTS